MSFMIVQNVLAILWLPKVGKFGSDNLYVHCHCLMVYLVKLFVPVSADKLALHLV